MQFVIEAIKEKLRWRVGSARDCLLGLICYVLTRLMEETWEGAEK